MPLYGHEMNEEVTPLETGLGFAVKMKKDDFIGKKALEEKGEPSRKRVGLKVTGRGIIREEQKVYLDGNQIGQTTSGPTAPILGIRWRWLWWMRITRKTAPRSAWKSEDVW